MDRDRAGPDLLRADAGEIDRPALRSMPGVCAVLASSELAGITRTPLCFQS